MDYMREHEVAGIPVNADNLFEYIIDDQNFLETIPKGAHRGAICLALRAPVDNDACDANEADSVVEPSNATGKRNDRTPLTWFRPDVDFRNPAGDAFLDTVLDLLPKQTGRGRRVRQVDLRARIRVILANGLRCYFHRVTPDVAYNRAFERRKGAPVWPTGRAMTLTTDLLASAGFLTLKVGKRTASFYAVTENLVATAVECGITRASLTKRVHYPDVVRLYGPKPAHKPWEPARKGERIDFQSTAQTRAWADELIEYNTFLFQHQISLALSPQEAAEWVASLNKDEDFEGTQFKLPELLQTDICRVFNNGNIGAAEQEFDQGGRLYGGWWINAPSRFRPRIIIDGCPTVELDYVGYHLNMLYHERGIECEGDPYTLPEIEAYEREIGVSARTFRPWVKKYTNALINCREGGRPANVKIDDDILVPAGIQPSEVIRMIGQRHNRIEDAFLSNAGLKLQRIDSEIAMEVITKAMRQGWVALPVHDSFITQVINKERLFKLMETAYKLKFEFVPRIKTIEVR